MFTKLLTWIFCLLIELTYSFRTFKHDLAFYYKTTESVFSTNPNDHTTSYGIYVAGQTITVDIPTSVVAVSDILDWKVVNLNKDRLMFVHNNKPQIMINRKTIKKMKFSGELSGPIIAFGDNEALHVPTIFNPEFTKPDRQWNFIELLYFDDQSEKVSVIRSLPWLKDDDWKYIKEWKMTDYIHFDNKLYLLIKRSIWNENSKLVTQEISIIRMCLDKGSEIVSSAVEIYFTRTEFNTDEIIDLIFVFIFVSSDSDKNRFQLHAIQRQFHSSVKIYQTYSISDIVSLLEETANECSSGSGNINLLRDHLRSQFGKCLKTNYESNSTKENIVPSKNIQINTTLLQSGTTAVHNLQFITLPYPYFKASVFMQTKPTIYTTFCEYITSKSLTCKNFIGNFNSIQFTQADFHINKYPYGFIYVTKETNQVVFFKSTLCANLKTCAQCIMYGLYSDCIWSNSICVHDNQPKNKTALTVDHCFKVIAISSLIFNSSLPTKLAIELDRPLNITASQEHLVVQAGYNRCTNITMSGSSINCSMQLTKSGKFKIDVSLRNDKYADATIISALSTDKVRITVPEIDYYSFAVILIILTVSLIGIFSSIVYSIKYNKQHNEFLAVKSSTKALQMGTKSYKSTMFSFSGSRSRSSWRSASKSTIPRRSKRSRQLNRYLKY